MSGFRNSPMGPRELNPAITSPFAGAAAPAAHVAVMPGWAPRNVSRSVFGPSRWIVGRKWLSVSTSLAVGLYRIIPAAPPCEAL
jgi:hypothetical protein